MRTAVNRRKVVAAAATAALAFGVAACNSSGSDSPSSSGTGVAKFWTLEDPAKSLNKLQQDGVDAFNKTGQGKVVMTTVATDGYLDKLRVSMGSDNMPGLFFSWGGGPMREYADAKKIVNVDSVAGGGEIRDHFLPSVLAIGEKDGKLYGVPARGTQPVFIFYNKKVFKDAGVDAPQTWDDITKLTSVFKSKDITPFALAGNGGSSWTELMWLEYLVDRIGGPDVFKKIATGDSSGWKDPAVLEAAQKIKDLIDAGAFGSKFGSVGYGPGGSSTLLATGKAAMQLMGSWEYAVQSGASEDFAKNDLGYVAFPAIPGGAGDPASVVGNPSNYISMTTSAPKKTAVGYLKTLYSDDYVKSLVDAGEVPVTTNAEKALKSAPNPEYAQFQFDMVKNAPSFTQSWDQALGFKIATPMLAALQNLFNGKSSPEDFVAAVSKLS
jgi:xylobiose transport system substrate-binding protein